MLYLLAYTCIVTLIILVTAIINVVLNADFRHYTYQPIMDANVIMLAILWPISFLCIIYFKIEDKYKEFVRKKIENHIWCYHLDPSYLDTLSIKDLKMMRHACNIRVIEDYSGLIAKKIENCILNKEFEKNFL